jgi:hypothetical protein
MPTALQTLLSRAWMVELEIKLVQELEQVSM